MLRIRRLVLWSRANIRIDYVHILIEMISMKT